MIYHVTNSKLPGQRARFKVDDTTGVIVAVFFDGKDFVRWMPEIVELAANVNDRSLRYWADVRVLIGGDNNLNITEAKEAEELPTNERVALFCRLYKQYKKVAYRMSPKDIGVMKSLPVSDAILKFYLDDTNTPDNSTTWLWKRKQSVKNLATYWNEVLTTMQVPVPVKSRHPDKWDRNYFNKLDGESISEYYRHLKSLGLVPRKHTDGSTIDWVKA